MYFISEFAAKVAELKDSVAITDRDGKRSLTYGELDSLSSKIAHKLAVSGVLKGDSVIIILPRISEYIACEIALLKLGAVVVPLIPDYPQERVAYIQKDSGAKMLIREDFLEGIDSEDAVCDIVDAGDDERAMILYTSGSTGKPKGVVYTRSNVDAHITRMRPFLKEISPLVFAASATMSFCVTVMEYLCNLSLGAHVHMISDPVRSDAGLLASYYTDNHIRTGFISPRILKLFDYKGADLVRVITASEKVVNIYSDDYEIYNCYGQSETIGIFTAFPIDRLYDNTPIGKALPGSDMVIIDGDGNELPDGQEGQICIIGNFPCEYNNLPDQTSQVFKKLPDGRTFIYSGDIGKKLPDGNVIYLNRNDWMIKIHGQRVEPGEIESVMNAVDGVTSSIVKAFDNDDGTMLLCGFYTESKPVDKAAIKKGLEDKLPHYMIPGAFVRMDAFPVNANGKVDRKSIGRPDFNTLTADYEEPVDYAEKAICDAMQKVLNIIRVGRNDNFFELGGNSLNAVALCSECKLEGITSRAVINGKTPKGIAELLASASGVLKPEFNRRYEVRDEYPMTLSNHYNFYDCEKIGESIDLMDWRPYYELDDTVDVKRLKGAIEDSLNAHLVYGIRFSSSRKLIRPSAVNAHVKELDIEPDKFMEYRRSKAASKRDLEHDPMFDVEIVHVGGEKTYLYFNMTHQVFDGASVALLYDEISNRYEGKEVAAEEYDIFDVASYEEEVRKGPFYKEAEEFFDRQLGSLKDKPRGDRGDHMDSSVRKLTSLDFAAIGKDAFLRKLGVSQIVYIQAALYLAAAKYMDREELTIKVLHSGRDFAEYNGIHGSVARAVFVLAKSSPDMTVADFMGRLQESYQESVYYDVIPMKELAEKYPAAESEIYLNYRGRMGHGFHLGNKSFEFLLLGYFFDGKHIEALLNMQIDELPDGRLSLSLGAGFFDQAKTERIAEAFEKALELIVTCEKVADILERI